ncbi:MAG TPA: pirin family protein, partial [Steroidobacteraceae bacterium]|nr:pirin family protein [Steroidobacteraceae bacterium]
GDRQMADQMRISGRKRDLGGGFIVQRVLPAAQRPSVGPFVFFDHFGPILVKPEQNFDVRPHPHIGLATVTYLFGGAMVHRDSLANVQRIEPGAINWMTAGRGVVHSERRPEDLRQQAYSLHGLQLWVALPKSAEDGQPGFTHYPAAALPQLEHDGATIRVLVGEALGARSPVQTATPTLYVDVQLPAGTTLNWPGRAIEQAVYSVDRPLELDGEPVAAQTLAILPPNKAVRVTAPDGARLVFVGGEPLDGPRLIWWNFVASTQARIDAAKTAWREQRLGSVPGDAEFIPLPEH